MAKESDAQKATVERVMHEFKHHDLESGNGAKVKSRKQAIAIALSEAGTSNQQSPAKNRRNEAKSRGEQSGQEKSRQDLYAEARKRDIPGRSKMSKAQLARALA